MACGSLSLDQKPSRLMMRRGEDLDLDDADDELFSMPRVVQCITTFTPFIEG